MTVHAGKLPWLGKGKLVSKENDQILHRCVCEYDSRVPTQSKILVLKLTNYIPPFRGSNFIELSQCNGDFIILHTI